MCVCLWIPRLELLLLFSVVFRSLRFLFGNWSTMSSGVVLFFVVVTAGCQKNSTQWNHCSRDATLLVVTMMMMMVMVVYQLYCCFSRYLTSICITSSRQAEPVWRWWCRRDCCCFCCCCWLWVRFCSCCCCCWCPLTTVYIVNIWWFYNWTGLAIWENVSVVRRQCPDGHVRRSSLC